MQRQILRLSRVEMKARFSFSLGASTPLAKESLLLQGPRAPSGRNHSRIKTSPPTTNQPSKMIKFYDCDAPR